MRPFLDVGHPLYYRKNSCISLGVLLFTRWYCVCHVPGQVLIDKNSGVTCVVNKTNTIDSTFRNFQMEVLAGDGNMVTKVR